MRRKRSHRPDTVTHDDPVKRQFAADSLDRVWSTDITQHRASDGCVYCCDVLDAWSRKVMGSSKADYIRSELVFDALGMAHRQRSHAGTIVHGDRGVQYTSWVFCHRLRSVCLVGSVGRVASSSTAPTSNRSGPRESNWAQRSSNGSKVGLVPADGVRSEECCHHMNTKYCTSPPKTRHDHQTETVRITGSSYRCTYVFLVITPNWLNVLGSPLADIGARSVVTLPLRKHLLNTERRESDVT